MVLPWVRGYVQVQNIQLCVVVPVRNKEPSRRVIDVLEDKVQSTMLWDLVYNIANTRMNT